MKTTKKIAVLSFITLLSVSIFSCEKDKRTPPDLTLETGTGFVSTDTTFMVGTTLKVKAHAKKTEDELKTFNASYAYDGATTTTTKDTYTISSSSEKKDYTKEYTFVLRNTAGTEEWSFSITDRDGNITTKKIKVTVTP